MSATPPGGDWQWADPDAERTEVLNVPPRADATRVDPAGWSGAPARSDAPPAAWSDAPTRSDAPSAGWHPAAAQPTAVHEGDVARRDPHGTVEWELQLARMSNRAWTDVGLLLLRLCSLPLVLHGLDNATGFGALVADMRRNAVGALAPEVFAGLLTAGQLALPVLLAVGLLTRLAGLAQVALVACSYALWVVAAGPVVDLSTGTLAGEAVLAYGALALPLVFTGAGRFSIDHALGASRRARRAEKRAAKRLSA